MKVLKKDVNVALKNYFLDMPQICHFVTCVDLKLEALKQIAMGLSYLHERNIVHGDLKCGSV